MPCPYLPYAWHWERAAFVWRRALKKGSNQSFGWFAPKVRSTDFFLDSKDSKGREWDWHAFLTFLKLWKALQIYWRQQVKLQALHSATSARPSSCGKKRKTPRETKKSERSHSSWAKARPVEFPLLFSVTRKGHPDPADPNLRPGMHMWHICLPWIVEITWNGTKSGL